MKSITILAVLFGGAFHLLAAEQETDCRPLSQALYNAVKGKEVEEVLKLLEKEVSATPKCSCELIRSSILGYKPRPSVVASMVNTAINAAPDYVEVIVMCALAAAPDAQAEILTVAEKYGIKPNPLDVPKLIGEGPYGQYLFTPTSPLLVNPPSITLIDP